MSDKDLQTRFDLNPFLFTDVEVASHITDEFIHEAARRVAQLNEKTVEQQLIIKQQAQITQLQEQLKKASEESNRLGAVSHEYFNEIIELKKQINSAMEFLNSEYMEDDRWAEPVDSGYNMGIKAAIDALTPPKQEE